MNESIRPIDASASKEKVRSSFQKSD